MTGAGGQGAEQADLGRVSATTLQQLRDALAGDHVRAPLSATALGAVGIRDQADSLLAVLAGHGKLACLAILDVALTERARHTRMPAELVWTGPESHSATARDTAVVLRHLFEGAQERVILAGYSFSHAETVLGPLHRVMRDRGVQATFFVNIEQPRQTSNPPDAHADAQLASFVAESWPFGAPFPRLFYDKRALRPGPPWCSLHAKCVVVDDTRAFLSSANFTDRGQDRNIEAGVLLHDPFFARTLAEQWMGLISAGHVGEWVP